MKSLIYEYPMAINHKYCLWMNMPSHHQMDFIKALHDSGVDLQVRFFGKVDESKGGIWAGMRSRSSWRKHKYVKASVEVLDESVPDWRVRIDIVPGIVGNRFLMDLVDRLIREKVGWVHWSEGVKPGWIAIMRLPLRKRYGRKINRYALGALAISKMAERNLSPGG